MARDERVKFDLKKHHRKSTRLKGYDYSQAGVYYVTIVTYQRDCLFGDVVNEEMILNKFGKIADECWRTIPEHFPNVELGAYAVMPNHVHGIVVITNGGRGEACLAPTPKTKRYATTFIGRNCGIIQIGGDKTHRTRSQRHRHLAKKLL